MMASSCACTSPAAPGAVPACTQTSPCNRLSAPTCWNERKQPITVNDGMVEINYRPFEIVTLRLKA